MKRRDFLKQGITVSAGLAFAGIPKLARFAGAQEAAKLARLSRPSSGFKLTILSSRAASVPVRFLNSTDYFKRQGDTWTGNYKAVVRSI